VRAGQPPPAARTGHSSSWSPNTSDRSRDCLDQIIVQGAPVRPLGAFYARGRPAQTVSRPDLEVLSRAVISLGPADNVIHHSSDRRQLHSSQIERTDD
jgi:hypothetical protein